MYVGMYELILNKISWGMYAFVEFNDPTDPEQRRGASFKHFRRLEQFQGIAFLEVYRAVYFDAIIALSHKPSVKLLHIKTS